MSIKSEFRKHIKEGMIVGLDFFGKEYTGEVVRVDLSIPTKESSLTIKNDTDGELIIFPISDSLAARIPYSSMETSSKENEEMDKEDYEVLGIPDLKVLCDDRGLEYKKNTTKLGLIHILQYNDEQKAKRAAERKERKRKKKLKNKKHHRKVEDDEDED